MPKLHPLKNPLSRYRYRDFKYFLQQVESYDLAVSIYNACNLCEHFKEK